MLKRVSSKCLTGRILVASNMFFFKARKSILILEYLFSIGPRTFPRSIPFQYISDDTECHDFPLPQGVGERGKVRGPIEKRLFFAPSFASCSPIGCLMVLDGWQPAVSLPALKHYKMLWVSHMRTFTTQMLRVLDVKSKKLI